MPNERTVYFDTASLIEGRTVKLIYKGILATPDTNEIYVHYGFGLLWENLQEVKLDKIDDTCYEADITLCNSDSINFCFRDDKNNWDNNETKNYTSEICKEEITIAKVEPTDIDVPRLKKSYLVAKKIKLTFYKVITYLPRLFKGQWKKKTAKAENQ
ncbi:MAG: hypothetical protein IJ220_00450 [Clostridia bacterium]|nr:hypothetical protein [Clostridia bacterium]